MLLETEPTALDKGVATIRDNYESVARRRASSTRTRSRRACRCCSRRSLYDDLRDADLVIEAVFEDMAIKRDVFATLDASRSPARSSRPTRRRSTSNAIAAATRRPQDVVGMHFFSPANVMKLLEVVRGARTAPDVLMTVMQLAKRIGKTAVVSGVCDGFIGNRMLEQYLRQAMFLLDEGASPRAGRRARSERSAWRWARSG